MAWQLAPALEVLRREVNEAWPTRNIASDGTVGDAAHRSRPSDHNPDEDGIVRALDLTHDPESGADMNLVVGRVVGQRDQRVSYVIWDGQITRSYKTSTSHPEPWTPQRYAGTNPHTAHAHFSVTREGRFDNQPWHIERHILEEDDMEAAFVMALYQGFFGGETDPEGYSYWLKVLLDHTARGEADEGKSILRAEFAKVAGVA